LMALAAGRRRRVGRRMLRRDVLGRALHERNCCT
jgi:hypothetical protein